VWIALLGMLMGMCFSVAIFQISPISDIAWAAGFLCLALLPIAVGIAITSQLFAMVAGDPDVEPDGLRLLQD
jgi:hypothetical protein